LLAGGYSLAAEAFLAEGLGWHELRKGFRLPGILRRGGCTPTARHGVSSGLVLLRGWLLWISAHYLGMGGA
jgi:hypothetical protein